MRFDRYGNWLGTTWAFRTFQQHHTEINDLYWNHVGAASFANYIARHAPPGTKPESLFSATGPNARRLANTTDEWRRHAGDFGNWVRLAAVLSISSYFELYMRSVVQLSLESDPAVRFGKPRAIDGVAWLKLGIRQDYEQDIKACVIGEWPKRIAQYKRLFGRVPTALVEYTSELESMRALRNGVGHAFGREPSYRPLLLPTTLPMARLSEKRLQKYLDAVGLVANAIDDHLGPAHIGEFETFLFFEKWRKGLRGIESLNPKKAFRRELMHQFKWGISLKVFTEELVDYYNAVR